MFYSQYLAEGRLFESFCIRPSLVLVFCVGHCRVWGRKSPSYFVDTVDLIIDNKQFDVPTSVRARAHLASQRVRFHLRTPDEGSQPEMTKPGRKKNKMNTGAVAKVCAGISNGRIVMWEYLPSRWNGEEAAKLYNGAVIKTLNEHRGHKARYMVFEDNDPAGYKSSKGMAAKADLGIKAVPSPPYSPDLNPLDYFVWDEIERRMLVNAPREVETVAAYKKRLRLTALRLPRNVVGQSVRCQSACVQWLRRRATALGLIDGVGSQKAHAAA